MLSALITNHKTFTPVVYMAIENWVSLYLQGGKACQFSSSGWTKTMENDQKYKLYKQNWSTGVWWILSVDNYMSDNWGQHAKGDLVGILQCSIKMLGS